jgi:hypothetical protein
MSTFVLTYKGGTRPETEAEQQAVMAAWGAWFGALGEAVAAPGNPFGGSLSVGEDGGVSEGAASGLGGYSVLTADSLADAAELAKGCPLIGNGGTVDVYETIAM